MDFRERHSDRGIRSSFTSGNPFGIVHGLTPQAPGTSLYSYPVHLTSIALTKGEV
jgi:hypothetical protein